MQNRIYHLQGYLLVLAYLRTTLNWYHFYVIYLVLYILTVLTGVQYAFAWLELNNFTLTSRVTGPKYDDDDTTMTMTAMAMAISEKANGKNDVIIHLFYYLSNAQGTHRFSKRLNYYCLSPNGVSRHHGGRKLAVVLLITRCFHDSQLKINCANFTYLLLPKTTTTSTIPTIENDGMRLPQQDILQPATTANIAQRRMTIEQKEMTNNKRNTNLPQNKTTTNHTTGIDILVVLHEEILL